MLKNPSEYFLMHKDIPVCLMTIDEDGNISKIRRNEDAAGHFPLGGLMNDMKFHEWWKDRAIPKTRHGAKTALQKLGYTSTGSALVNNLALSLSDCYWIKPRGELLAWKDVNLFSNDFVDSFGDITLNRDHVIDLRNKTRFNCATSQGELQKKWCIARDGRRYLIKGNYGESYQQSLNEIFATELHVQQGFEHYTPYSLVKLKVDGDMDGLGCLCFDFCSENIECISAWEILQTGKLKQNESFYFPFKKACLSLGMQESVFNAFIDYQIMTDYLISNTDRHMNNIALMRDPDTLQLLGFAPIFDSGNSMFYNIPSAKLPTIRINDIRTHSFVEKESRLLQYVHDRGVVDLDKVNPDFKIYDKDIEERHHRIPVIEELFLKKVKALRRFQEGEDLWKRMG